MLYFLSHPIQYFSPLLRALARDTGLQVYYYSDSSLKGHVDKGFGKAVHWDTPLLEGYTYHFLDNWVKEKVPNSRFLDVFNPSVIKVIRRSPDKIIIINGWGYSSNWMVVIAGRLYGKKIWLRAENPLNQELRKSGLIRGVKRIVLENVLFRLLDKCMYIGTESREFFRYYKVPDRKLLFTPYGVDNSFFEDFYRQYRDRLPELKEQLKLPPDKKIILFTGKYIYKKRPLDLLEALRRPGLEEYFLVMVGDGELRGEMESFIRQNGLENRVHLTGFVNQTEITRYYAVADVFILCSGMGETWGLVVNEAMNFAKPVIVSRTCGCSVDLVKEGVNGFTFPEGDTGQLADRIREILSDDARCREMGEASLRIVKNYSIEAVAENIRREITE